MNAYIARKHNQQVAEINIGQLVSELNKLEKFEWGGDYQNSLDKFLISHFVKIPLYLKFGPNRDPAFSYDILISRLENEVNNNVKNYVLASWYNHWSSILIENIFKSHPSVLPVVGQIKSVDFFIEDTPFDLKVTYLPVEDIRLKRKEKGLPVELTFLKNKAREAGIYFDTQAKPADIYQEITERMKDRNDEFCRSILAILKSDNLQILKDAQNNPKMLLISKMFQLRRHIGRDCRYPVHRDVILHCRPWLLDSGNPCRNDVSGLAETSC